MVTTKPKRRKYTCPSYGNSVYNLDDHNRRIHKSVKKVRTAMLDVLEARRQRGIKVGLLSVCSNDNLPSSSVFFCLAKWHLGDVLIQFNLICS